VYGHLGPLTEVPYGAFDHAVKAANKIELTRATVDEAIQARVKPLLQSATFVNFVGFGFDTGNLAVLGTESFKGKRVYATSRGLNIHARRRATKIAHVTFPTKSENFDALQLLNTVDIFGPKKKRANTVRLPLRKGFVQ
jgi:hypothetical protein